MMLLRRGIQRLGSHIGRLLPKSVQKEIYLIPFYLLRKSLSARDEVWFRHSVYFNDIVFAYSDLDLSLLLRETCVESVERRVKLLKCVFPFVGEVSYFDDDYLSSLKPYLNSVEIKRDPELERRLEKKEALAPVEEEIVFILNWLSHDSHKMREDFKKRKRKRDRFFQLLNVEKREVHNIEELIEILLKEKFQNYFDDLITVKKFLIEFSHYDFSMSGANNEFYFDFKEFRYLLFVFFPQRWIGASLHFNEFDKFEEFTKRMTPFENKVFLSQMNWEIGGLMGQWRKGDDLVNLLIHCENLKKVLKPFGQSANLQRRGLDQLIQWQESGLHHGVKNAG